MFSCLSIVVSRLVSPIHVEVWKNTPSLRVGVSQVCSVGLDKNKREVFMVKEGVFLLSDGKSFKVLNQNGIL